MLSLDYCVLDVFTSTPYEGNPLALIKLLPDQSKQLTQEQKLKIAKEFNLSESIFVHLPHPVSSEEADEHCTPGHQDGDFKVDIFLTTGEIPFAGHPTIGAATWLATEGYKVKRLITKSGPISIEVRDGMTHARIAHDFHVHDPDQWHREALFDKLTQHSADQGYKMNIRLDLCSIVKGMTFLMVQLASTDDLETVHDVLQKGFYSSYPTISDLDQGWQSGFLATYYYVKSKQTGSTLQIDARMMEGSGFEDPATGSAASALTCCLAQDSQDATTVCEITQGKTMGRPSAIKVKVDRKSQEIDTVTLSGTAVQVMAGQLKI